MKNSKRLLFFIPVFMICFEFSAVAKGKTQDLEKKYIGKMTLSWRSSPFARGYKVYFGSKSGIYNSKCINSYISPIVIRINDLQNPNTPNLKINRSLIIKECFIAISSFDEHGKESVKSRDIRIK